MRLPVLAVAAGAIVGLMTLCADARAQQRSPNIVVIVADDMGYGDVGAYGGADIPSPNIDAVARGGVRFTDADVSGPVCSPNRDLAGNYPDKVGELAADWTRPPRVRVVRPSRVPRRTSCDAPIS
jgi:arylsulfatase A-like enzyme